ncbi:hypothetical protein G5B30_06870 [Sphingobacterium sp. SGG-5]|uniref:carbohydrate-binding family 9-like protein n=1 Tax=Sphingobacterium sp. SGG-5 TaxID=2710881 RepID=UPI0013EAF08F|nr:carbohydrate-binding family 9-like protein [Sphingobacterium sp. SGG-5]NGM61637.1 hypothetical protein [Sphingobacterium sp. SGG-5]
MTSILTVSKIEDKNISWANDQFDTLFISSQWHAVDNSPWQEAFPYKPDVRFQIVHSEDTIYIRYEVEEEYVKAQYIRPNESVYEDSCVEFFISLDNKHTYYNFEFNVLGTGLIGYGPAVKADRLRLDPAVVEQVNTFSQVFNSEGKKRWRLVLGIPKRIFNQEVNSGRKAYANFYKCGDKLPQPHFLAWNDIENPTPNFHLPQFFGELSFE